MLTESLVKPSVYYQDISRLMHNESIILPVVVYGFETRSFALTERSTQEVREQGAEGNILT
jgi:hypothetical protein